MDQVEARLRQTAEAKRADPSTSGDRSLQARISSLRAQHIGPQAAARTSRATRRVGRHLPRRRESSIASIRATGWEMEIAPSTADRRVPRPPSTEFSRKARRGAEALSSSRRHSLPGGRTTARQARVTSRGRWARRQGSAGSARNPATVRARNGVIRSLPLAGQWRTAFPPSPLPFRPGSPHPAHTSGQAHGSIGPRRRTGKDPRHPHRTSRPDAEALKGITSWARRPRLEIHRRIEAVPRWAIGWAPAPPSLTASPPSAESSGSST